MNSSVFQLDWGLETNLVSYQLYFTEQELKIQRPADLAWETGRLCASEQNLNPDSRQCCAPSGRGSACSVQG